MGSSETDETLESYGSDIGGQENSLARIREWILVGGDRLFLALMLSITVFLILLSLNRIGAIAFVNADSVTRLAGGMIAGTFSLVTLVVSINQLILSRDFAAAGEVRNRIGGVMEFQRDIEDATKVPAAPATPTELLDLLVTAIHHCAEDLSEATADHDDEDVRTLIAQYTNTVTESTERIDETLETTAFGTFNAVSAAVDYDDAWQLYAARQLRNDYRETLSEEAIEAFDDLIETVQLFNVAREQFKSTYLQRELTRFSQLTIYIGIPAVLSAVLIGLLYSDFGGSAIDLEYLPIVTSALIAVVFSPLTLLSAYILRTATVTRRTASTGPMLPQKDPDEGTFDVSYGDEE